MRRAPRASTVHLLAKALDLTEADRAGLLVVARLADRHQSAIWRLDDVAVLPQPLTRFIGRVDELNDLVYQLSNNRLVTVIGFGGTGKTRLAVEAGHLWHASVGGPVRFVELAALSRPELVAHSVAECMQVVETPGQTVQPNLIRRIAGHRLLLILDNAEHLIEACASLADELLQACPGLTVLFTSREALRLAGEHRFVLGPMEVPDRAAKSAKDLAHFDAVEIGSPRIAAVDTPFARKLIQNQILMAIDTFVAHVRHVPATTAS